MQPIREKIRQASIDKFSGDYIDEFDMEVYAFSRAATAMYAYNCGKGSNASTCVQRIVWHSRSRLTPIVPMATKMMTMVRMMDPISNFFR